MPEFRFVSLIIVVIALIVYPLQAFLPTDQLILVSSEVLDRPWTLLTHMFLHGSARHLLSNMIALGIFGFILERLIGWRRFLLVFFLGGFVSSIGDIIFYSATLGASGALFAVLGTLAIMRPKMGVPAFGTILPMAAAAVLWVLLDLSGFPYPDGIAHAAHLFGMAAGVLFGLYYRKYFPSQKSTKEQSPISDHEHRKWEKKYMIARND